MCCLRPVLAARPRPPSIAKGKGIGIGGAEGAPAAVGGGGAKLLTRHVPHLPSGANPLPADQMAEAAEKKEEEVEEETEEEIWLLLFGRLNRGDAAGESGPCGEVEGVEPVSEMAAVLCAKASPPQPEERASRALGGAGAPQPAARGEEAAAYEASEGREAARLPRESRAPALLLPHVRADTLVAMALTKRKRDEEEVDLARASVGMRIRVLSKKAAVRQGGFLEMAAEVIDLCENLRKARPANDSPCHIFGGFQCVKVSRILGRWSTLDG